MPKSQFRRLLATLCVALSFVFAGTSAASVVDRVQHATQITHEHAGLTAPVVIEADHHVDHHPDSGQPLDSDAQTDRHPTTGHHHHYGETSSGAPGTGAEPGGIILTARVTLVTRGADRADGVQPGSLERPPKATQT